jgi:hypothetical protein
MVQCGIELSIQNGNKPAYLWRFYVEFLRELAYYYLIINTFVIFNF